MSEQIRSLLVRLREGLEETYGARLRGLYLYGSFARGDEDNESDVDILIVLDRIDTYGTEVDRTSALISALSLESGLSISRVFVTHHDWIDRDSPFLANVREEAMCPPGVYLVRVVTPQGVVSCGSRVCIDRSEGRSDVSEAQPVSA